MEVKSDVVKDVGFTNMSEFFAIVEVLIKNTFFEFSPFIYLLVGSQGCSVSVSSRVIRGLYIKIYCQLRQYVYVNSKR